MSDIQEEQKRLYKRAEENDIKLLREEINRLNNIINKAVEYIEIGLANEEEAEELLNILKGDNK